MKRKAGVILLPLLFWLAVWAIAAGVVGQTLLLPGPWLVLTTLIRLAGQSLFWQTAVTSLMRMFLGILAGAVLGAALAALTAYSGVADLLLSPAIKVIRAVPVASFILLVLLWVRRDWVPVAISALMVLPVVWGAVRQGIAEADPQLLELAHCYRLGRGRTVHLVYLPAVRPAFAGGLATAMGLAWKAGVAAEVLCAPKMAVGTQIYRSKLNLETPELFAWTLVVIVLSLFMEGLIAALLRREAVR